MPSENAERIKSFYERLNQGDDDGALELVPEDIVLDLSRSMNPDTKGTHTDRAAVKKFLDSFSEAWDDVEWFDEEYIELGEDVIRVGGVGTKGRGSGVEVVGRGAQLRRFGGSDARRMELYQDKEEALAAAREGE